MARKTQALCLLMCLCALLTGCEGSSAAPGPRVTLPPVRLSYTAPENDVNQERTQSAVLYLPSADGTRLVALPETAKLSASRRSAETLCQMLFSCRGDEQTMPLGGQTELRLSETEAVEVSGSVATVSLGASALRLSHEQLFTVGQALANTLCQFGDVEYVNVLVNGVQPGLDVASTLPAGCFQPNVKEDLGTLWARASAKTQGRRALTAALYYPAAGGRGILCEARTLSFPDTEAATVIRTLLEALSSGAETIPEAPRYPDLLPLLVEEPKITEIAGARRAVLHFDEALNQLLITNGITRSMMAASLVYTVTTFVPALDGVEMIIGDETITSVTPSGTCVHAGETIHFPSRLMRRGDFSVFLLAPCPLYFADEKGVLCETVRYVPFYESCSARKIIDQLMTGPQNYDTVSRLSPVLPEGLRDADLIGVSLEKETLVLNFSSRLVTLSQDMSPEAERSMVYAVVNSLCRLQGVKRVSFFIMGEQPETFAGAVFLPGDFLPTAL